MGHCKDCLFWEPYRNVMVCVKATTYDAINSSCSVEAAADDDSGLDAWLVTGPEFGCVKFLAKKS